jgi:uncharacterized integral membrane protein
MRLLNSIVAFLIGLLVVLFAVSNRQRVTLEIWPLPYQLSLGLYAVILLALLMGFAAGAIGAWMVGGTRRREHRRLKRQLRSLEQSLAEKAAKADMAVR